MKKIFLILTILCVGFLTQAQQINYPQGNLLLYSDTSTLVDGSEFVINLYGYLPSKLGDGIYEYQYNKVFLLDGEQIYNDYTEWTSTPYDILLISGIERTYDWMYPQIITIDEANWEIASWQTYLQKIHNQ